MGFELKECKTIDEIAEYVLWVLKSSELNQCNFKSEAKEVLHNCINTLDSNECRCTKISNCLKLHNCTIR